MSRFEDVLTLDEFDSVSEGELKKGRWTEIARYQIKRGEARAWGYTQVITIADVLKGHIKGSIGYNDGTTVTTLSKGKIRLKYESVNREATAVYMTFNLSEIVNGKDLAEDEINIAVEDAYLIVEVMPLDADFTWNKAGSSLEVSTTVYT